jgi:hypothetical protein
MVLPPTLRAEATKPRKPALAEEVTAETAETARIMFFILGTFWIVRYSIQRARQSVDMVIDPELNCV